MFVNPNFNEILADAIKEQNLYYQQLEEQPEKYEALLDFAHWVAKFVCVPDEDWEDEYCGNAWIFPELACRKLYKLGIIGKDDDKNWTYEAKK